MIINLFKFPRKIWTIKPPVGTPLNRSHPYCQGLWAAWVFNENAGPPIELVNQRRALSAAAFTWTSSVYGPVGSFNGTSTDLQYSNLGLVGPAISLAGRCSMAAPSSANGMMIERETVNGTWEVFAQGGEILWRGGSNAARAEYSIASIAANQYFSWCFTDLGLTSGASLYAYLNGVAQVSGGSSSQTPAVSNNNIVHLGNYDDSGYFFGGTQDYIYVWNYAIPATMVADIAANPWQIFAPKTGSLNIGNINSSNAVIFLFSHANFLCAGDVVEQDAYITPGGTGIVLNSAGDVISNDGYITQGGTSGLILNAAGDVIENNGRISQITTNLSGSGDSTFSDGKSSAGIFNLLGSGDFVENDGRISQLLITLCSVGDLAENDGRISQLVAAFNGAGDLVENDGRISIIVSSLSGSGDFSTSDGRNKSIYNYSKWGGRYNIKRWKNFSSHNVI